MVWDRKLGGSKERVSTPTAREFGYAEREIAEIKHALASLKMVSESNQERIMDLEMDYLRLSTRIWTAIAVVGGLVSSAAMVFQVATWWTH
jgi:hypothetical protein